MKCLNPLGGTYGWIPLDTPQNFHGELLGEDFSVNGEPRGLPEWMAALWHGSCIYTGEITALWAMNLGRKPRRFALTRSALLEEKAILSREIFLLFLLWRYFHGRLCRTAGWAQPKG